MVGWDPRGYGKSRPPERDFPPDFLERDAKDAVDLMKVCLCVFRTEFPKGINIPVLF